MKTDHLLLCSLFTLILCLALVRWRRRTGAALIERDWGVLAVVPYNFLWPTLWCAAGVASVCLYKAIRLGGTPSSSVQAALLTSLALVTILAFVASSRHAYLMPVKGIEFMFRRENTGRVSLHFALHGAAERRRLQAISGKERYAMLLDAHEVALREALRMPEPIVQLELLSVWFSGDKHKRTLDELRGIIERTYPGTAIVLHVQSNFLHVVVHTLLYRYRSGWHAVRSLFTRTSYQEAGFLLQLPEARLR